MAHIKIEDPPVKKARLEKRAETMVRYREIIKDLREIQVGDDPQQLQKYIDKNFAILKELYPLAKKKLDTTSQDSKAVRLLFSIGSNAAKTINRISRSFEMKRCLRTLMREQGDEHGNRMKPEELYNFITTNYVKKDLGNAPTQTHMYGFLSCEGLKPKPKRERIRQKDPETATVTAKQKDLETDVEQDTTPREVENMLSKLTEITSRDREASFFQTVVHPSSFTQTVENIFHVSFLVKTGKVGVKKDKDKKPVLVVERDNENEDQDQENASENEPKTNHQSILSFSMKDYHNWIAQFHITEQAMPGRSTIR